jgi:hypothetical protein
MLIQEQFVNVTKGYRFGDSEPYEPFTDDVGKLYKHLVKEYGRCTGKVFIDTPKGAQAVGWVFVSRQRYEDARTKDDTYLREAWVTLYDEADTVTRVEHYHAL